MYSLLIIDDEYYAVQGLVNGIDWTELEIVNVHAAYDAEEAKNIIQNENIDVMICDIEMPYINGIQLLEWVKSNYSSVKVIFLTGHANFSYAQKALHLDCFDYLLKPVDHGQLKQVVANVLKIIYDEKEVRNYLQTYEKYYKLWETKKLFFIEHFWQDLLDQRIPASPQTLNHYFELYNMHLSSHDNILIILIRIEQWDQSFSERDKEIMAFGLRNIASEVILDNFDGIIVQEHNGDNLAIIYLHEEFENIVENLEHNCKRFINNCNEYMNCNLSCYIGERNLITDVVNSFQTLKSVSFMNITNVNDVIFQSDYKNKKNKSFFKLPAEKWEDMLDMGKKEELLYEIKKYINSIDKDELTIEFIDVFYHGLVTILYNVMHKYGISIYDALGSRKIIIEGLNIKTISQVDEWSSRIISQIFEHLSKRKKDESAVIEKVKNYIGKHISEEFTRDVLAGEVFLNAEYLSRLFKKETGTTLSEYIINLRMNTAKKQLVETNHKISSIAEDLSYYNFSHFAKTFKRTTGMTPQEYRAKFQTLS